MPARTPDDTHAHLDSIMSTLRMRRAPEQIADRMLAAILVGVLPAGERLPSERQLTIELGVSRETVRAALRRLVETGVVETKRGRRGGTFVRGADAVSDTETSAVLRTLEPVWRDMEQLLDMRCLVNGLIAGVAARRRTDEHVAEMRSAVKQYAAADNPRDSRAADHRLHHAIAEGCGNPYLVDLGDRMTTAVNLGFHRDPWTIKLHDDAAIQHAAIVEAIAEGDATQAGDLAAQHFQLTTTVPWRDILHAAREADEAGNGDGDPEAGAVVAAVDESAESDGDPVDEDPADEDFADEDFADDTDDDAPDGPGA